MTTDSELLAEIAEDYTVRLRSEDQPSIDLYVRKHPALANDIRKLLPSIRAMEQLSHREHSERKFERKTKRLTLAPDGLLGDFKIIGEIGRGGMGVVYEAEQQSLKRRVALKILGPTMASSPKQLARFQSEAKAVARLHHTNIVSVYGVGDHEGLYYYAMQLIDGMTLSEAIAVAEPNGDFVSHHGPLGGADDGVPLADRPTDVREPRRDTDAAPATVDAPEVTQSGPQQLNDINRSLHSASRWNEIALLCACVADALDYAHSNGVLHRDIKPSNLILDRHGDIWITDFGLAHHEDMDGVTATGDIVGTMRYMAPEQFDGVFDGRCDTYSLGMTIYEMLTLRPAFTAAPKRLIKLKTTSQPPTPRSINPDIPRDLETIALKACAINPAQRYETPAELAADLRRFLEDRPIHARRITWRERIYRWARRNPLAAALGVLSLISMTSVFIVFAVLNLQLRGAVRELTKQQSQEAFHRRLAESRAETTSAVTLELQGRIDGLIAGVENRGLPEPVEWEVNSEKPVSLEALSQSDVDILRDQAKADLLFAEKFGEKVESEAGAARAMASAGDKYQRLGEYDEAAKCYVDALDRFTSLLKRKRNSLDFLTYQVRMHARIDEVRGRLTDASIIPEDAGSQTGMRLLREDPGKILTSSARARYEFVRTLHSRHYAMLQQRQRLRLIGIEYPPESYSAEIIESNLGIDLLQPLLTEDIRDYTMLSVRIRTDRGRLELLSGNAEQARLYLGIAARDLDKLLVNHEAEEMRASLQAELAYVVCLAPGRLAEVHSENAIASLELLVDRLEKLDAKEPLATRAKEIASVARKKLAEYRVEAE